MSRADIKCVRQQDDNCWFCVLTSGTPSTQARKGTWLMEALAAAGVRRTNVLGRASGRGQGKNGLRSYLPCPAFVSAGPRHV